MVWTSPVLLVALAGLPLLWWLLRAIPPAPRRQTFPAIRLLAGLARRAETPARTPIWLLALRMGAAGLIVIGFAGPVRDPAPTVRSGPVLLLIDDGWAASADWPARLRAAGEVLSRAERDSQPVALLTTAPGPAADPPHLLPAQQAAGLRPVLAMLAPKPWPTDRASATYALTGWPAANPIVYLADGVADAGDAKLRRALQGRPVTEILADPVPVQMLGAPRAEADRLVVPVRQLPRRSAARHTVLAQTGAGGSLARIVVTIPAGDMQGDAVFALPPELRNQLTQLVLSGPPGAGGVALLDEASRRRPLGLLRDGPTDTAPLTGALYYLRKAVGPTHEIREGDLPQLLSRALSVIVVADRPITPDETDRLATWVRRGGLLIRFAGPRMATASRGLAAEAGDPDETGMAPPSAADPLLPVTLLGGDRQLGGAMSWSKPAALAPFPSTSPFAGLPVPPDVTISRQVLAQPGAALDRHVWARLQDGTPLVTGAALGAGQIVLFHVTANTDWSNLPLSGLFPAMLDRLADLAVGVNGPAATGPIAPIETLDGFGRLGPPPPAAGPIAADRLATAPVSPRHPPGLYGPDRLALNLGAATNLAAAPPIPGATIVTLGGAPVAHRYGPALIAAGLILLAADLLIGLRLRGLLHAGLAMLALLALPSRAATPVPGAALAPTLAWIASGDPQTDQLARQGLMGLSDYVNRHTAAQLAAPVPVSPGRDDLSFYPLLYWPVAAGVPTSPTAIVALNDYMRHGGIVVIDSRADAGVDLRTTLAGLDVPPLARLGPEHVLAHDFYLLTEFPGRAAGTPVWVQRDTDPGNDSVSPVIVGGGDWAAAWAVDETGGHPIATSPGGERQRTLAYRFGVNLVIYALTGNYKGDQIHVPALLQRLGR